MIRRGAQAVGHSRKGHHVAVFASVYVLPLALLGLFLLLAYLRDVLGAAPDGERLARIFWGMGIGAATSFAVGWRSSLAMRSHTPSAAAASSSIRPSRTWHPSSVSRSSSGLRRSSRALR
jgi:hypothetical protein